MRKISSIFLILTLSCFSQNKQILYNFTSIPQSLLTNPGLDVKYNWYFGVPLLSGVSANMGSSGFSAYDLFADDGVDFNSKLRAVVNSASSKDNLSVNQQLEIFSGGYKIGGWNGNSYLSFGMYQEFDLLGYVPKDPAILALDGNRDYLGKFFNLSDLNARTELLTVLHLGYHKAVSEKLILGVRGKIYSSIFNATSTKNSGYIYTIPNANGVYYNQEMSSNIRVNTSGIVQFTKEDYEGDVVKDLRKKAFMGGNLGLGFDLGMTYYPQKNLQFTASILDVGFISHSKDVENYTLKGVYKFEGINPDFINGSDPDDALDDFKNAIPLDTLYTKYTTWRPIKVNASFQYSFGKELENDCNCTNGDDAEFKNALGAQLFFMSRPVEPYAAITAYYRRNLFKGFDAKATYTIDQYTNKNIGIGLSSEIGLFQFYVLADNVLEYKDLSKANSLAFQVGFNIMMKNGTNPN